MKLVCKEEALKEIRNVLAAVCEDALVTFGKDGLGIVGIDTSHVAMVELTVPAKSAAFSDYDAAGEEVVIPLDRLKDVVSLAEKGELVSVELIKEKAKAKFTVGNIWRQIGLIDPKDVEHPRLPKLDLPAGCTVPTAELRRGLEAAGPVSDYVGVSLSAEELLIEGEGDTERSELRIPKPEGATTNGATMKTNLPLDYLTAMVKQIAAEKATLRFADDFPLRLEFDLSEGGSAHYILAPRIEES